MISIFSPIFSKTKRIFSTVGAGRSGSVLIGLIVAMIIISSLIAAMIAQTATSSWNIVSEDRFAKAYYLAESGFRYAAAKLKHSGESALDTLHNHGSYSLGNQGSFTIQFETYLFEVDNLDVANELVTEVPFGNAAALTDDDAATLVPDIGEFFYVKIGDSAAQAVTDIVIQDSGGTPDPNGEYVKFTSTGNWSALIGERIKLVVKSNGDAVSEGGDLNLQVTSPADAFPLHNGRFVVDNKTYRYQKRETDKLVGIYRVDDSVWAAPILSDGTEIVLQDFTKLHSTGTFGDGNMEISREIIYNIPIATLEKAEFHDTFEDKSHWDAPTLDSHEIQTIGGDSALKVNITPTAGVIDTSLIAFKWSDISSNLNLATRHQDAGFFLSYDAQIKIGFDPQPVDWEFPAGTPFPELYVAGITFRLNTSNNGYGVSFLRGDNSFTDSPQDGIPNSLMSGSIDVRVSTGSDDAEEAIGGNMNLGNQDLDLVNQGVEQIIGIRFQNIAIPQGAAITNAYIEFKANASDSDITTNIKFYAEDSDDAPTFTNSANDISNRPKTSAMVPWDTVPDWIGGEKYKTLVDLSDIIQEVIDRSGWSSGNDLVIIVTGPTDTKRVAESYEGDSANAPLLHVEYELNEIPLVMLWQQTAANTWTWLAYKRLPDVFTIPADDEATLMVRVVEGAGLSFSNGDSNGGSPIEDGDKILGSFSGASATVNSTPIVDSGDWSAGTAAGTLTLQNISGTFSNEPLTVIGSVATATAGAFRSRDNYIKVYYGDVSGNGTPNDNPLDDQTLGNPRGVIHWPPDKTENTADHNDYYTLVQWDVVNPDPVVSSDTAFQMGTGKELNAIIRSNTFTTPSDNTFNQPEIGLHTIGNSSPFVYFDDFAIQVEIPTTTGFLPAIQE